MKDMEKLYIKESRPRRRKTEAQGQQSKFACDQRIRGCRSNSLKNRLLVIARDKNNKCEWIILPQPPSKLKAQEDMERVQKVQKFDQFLDNYDVSFS